MTCRSCLALLLLCALSGPVSSDAVYPDNIGGTLQQWLAPAEQDTDHFYQVYSESQSAFLVIATLANSEDSKDYGRILLLNRLPDNRFQVAVAVQQQQFLPGVMLEAIVVELGKFVLQYSASTPCGPVVTQYRFKQYQQEWGLTGLDQQRSERLDNGEIATGYTLSKNFLIGTVIQEFYQQGKPHHHQKTKVKFPRMLLNDFQPFADIHGELL